MAPLLNIYVINIKLYKQYYNKNKVLDFKCLILEHFSTSINLMDLPSNVYSDAKQ